GEDGELVSSVEIDGYTATPMHVVSDTSDGDVVNAGDGRNLVFGDSAEIYASAQNTSRLGALPITLGIVTTVASTTGGSDRITTAVAEHRIADATKGDSIAAGNGVNVVLGDSAAIYAAAADAPNFGTQPITFGLVTSIAPSLGGNDTITTGSGRDLVIGGVGGDT